MLPIRLYTQANGMNRKYWLLRAEAFGALEVFQKGIKKISTQEQSRCVIKNLYVLRECGNQKRSVEIHCS